MLAYTRCKKCQKDTKKDALKRNTLKSVPFIRHLYAGFSLCHVLVTEQYEKVFWPENKHSRYFWLQHASTSLFPFSRWSQKKQQHRRATHSTIYTSTSVHTAGANTGAPLKLGSTFNPFGFVCLWVEGCGEEDIHTWLHRCSTHHIQASHLYSVCA